MSSLKKILKTPLQSSPKLKKKLTLTESTNISPNNFSIPWIKQGEITANFNQVNTRSSNFQQISKNNLNTSLSMNCNSKEKKLQMENLDLKNSSVGDSRGLTISLIPDSPLLPGGVFHKKQFRRRNLNRISLSPVKFIIISNL